LNFYSYTFNSPTNLTDPSGKFVWIPVIVGVGGGIVGAVGEGSRGYKCGDRGWRLAGDIGRGFASGGVAALVGLYVTVVSENPFAGGAAGSIAGDTVNGLLGGGFDEGKTLQNALVGGVLGVASEGIAQRILPVRGGQNFNPLKSPRTFGPRAGQLYGGK
jgi:hypothetical protein